jgi:spore maturation protein CgeB
MGHEVNFYSPHTHLASYSTNLLLRIYRRISNGRVLSSHRIRHLKDFVKAVQNNRPEIVIVLKGLLVDARAVKQIQDNGAWVCMINHDDFFSAFATSRSAEQFAAVPHYNYIFCTKEVNVAEMQQYNLNTGFLQFAYHPSIHFPPVTDKPAANTLKFDIVFVGNRYPEREAQLLYLRRHLPSDVSMRIYGPNWKRFVPRELKPVVAGHSLNAEQMRSAVYHSSIALGFLCKQNRDDYTQRSFEIPAMKGVFLGERTERHLSFYKENEEAVFFAAGNNQELISQIRKLLEDKQLRTSIRENGYKRVTTSGHTYEDRMRQLLDVFERSAIAASDRTVAVEHR